VRTYGNDRFFTELAGELPNHLSWRGANIDVSDNHFVRQVPENFCHLSLDGSLDVLVCGDVKDLEFGLCLEGEQRTARNGRAG
jgi:hypothetical protein